MQYWGTPKHKKTNFHFFGNKLIFILVGGGGGETRKQVPRSHGRASYRKLLEKNKSSVHLRPSEIFQTWF